MILSQVHPLACSGPAPCTRGCCGLTCLGLHAEQAAEAWRGSWISLIIYHNNYQKKVIVLLLLIKGLFELADVVQLQWQPYRVCVKRNANLNFQFSICHQHLCASNMCRRIYLKWSGQIKIPIKLTIALKLNPGGQSSCTNCVVWLLKRLKLPNQQLSTESDMSLCRNFFAMFGLHV